MRHPQQHPLRALGAAVFAGVLLLGLGAGSASGASAPTDIQKASELGKPGVVLVVTRANVKATINDTIDLPFYSVPKRSTTRANYPDGAGAGFVVTPDGAIVTASHVVDPNPVLMRRAITEKLFQTDRAYVDTLRAQGNDADANDLSNALDSAELRCVHQITCKFTIVPVVRVYAGFAQGSTKLLTEEPASILNRTGFAKTDVAVLKIPGNNLPTVPLAKTAINDTFQGGEQVVALGFPETTLRSPASVTEATPRYGQIDSVTQQGTSWQINASNVNIEHGNSGGPLLDEKGEVIGLASFFVAQSNGESGNKVFRTVDDIHSALANAGVAPARGDIDTWFQKGMDLYWKDAFKDSIPWFDKVISLQEGHIQAKRARSDALIKAGTPEDTSSSGSSGMPGWAWVLIALGVIALIGVGIYALMRSGKLKRSSGAEPKAAPKTDGVAPVPERGRTVLSPRPGEPTLVVQAGPDAGQRFVIKTDTMLGRDEADINLDDAEVSRRHAMIRRVNGSLELSDLRSANGTRINGTPVEGTHELSDGDTIQLGQTTLAVEMPPGGSSGRSTSTTNRPEGR